MHTESAQLRSVFVCQDAPSPPLFGREQARLDTPLTGIRWLRSETAPIEGHGFEGS